MEDTPTKTVLVENCFVCLKNKRYYGLKGKKAIENELLTKINKISGKKIEDFLSQYPTKVFGICRLCCSQLNSAYSFQVQLINTIENSGHDHEEEQPRFKRMATSPLTPKLKLANDSVSSKLSKRSRVIRPLDLKEDDSSCTNSPLPVVDHCYSNNSSVLSSEISTRSSVDFEHSYSKVTELNEDSQKEKPSVASTLECLKSHIRSHLVESDKSSSLVNDIVDVIFSHKVLLKAVERKMLTIIRDTCSTLSSRNVALSSVLSRYRSITSLMMFGDQLLNEIIHEISQRIPFLLNIFTTICSSTGEPTEQKIAPIAAAYAILMNTRSEKLSAWHRLTTIIATKGHLDDSALTTLNHLGVCLSATTKTRLLDEAGNGSDIGIVSDLKNNPLVKVTGDNLDIYVRTGHKSLEKHNKDLHLFASNIIFSRIAQPHLYSIVENSIPLEKLTSDLFLPHGHYTETLMNSYIVLLGRMLSEL